MELHFSENTKTIYLKFPPYSGANHYKISFSNGRKSEFTERTVYQVPDEVSLREVTISVTPYKDGKKLDSRKTFQPSNTDFFIIK